MVINIQVAGAFFLHPEGWIAIIQSTVQQNLEVLKLGLGQAESIEAQLEPCRIGAQLSLVRKLNVVSK